MPTRRGYLLGLAGLGLLLVGRLLALIQLDILAGVIWVLVVLAVIYVRIGRVDLDVARELNPSRLHAGTSARVEVSIVNFGSRTSPLLRVTDPYDGGIRVARFLVAPLVSGAGTRAAYGIPAGKRGLHRLGPLRIEMADPFGVAARIREASSETSLIVYPATEPVHSTPHGGGDDPFSGLAASAYLNPLGDDFYALRSYQVGDDLRRVHWPASAHSGELLIRQQEMPWEGRLTVAVDLRKAGHSPESFEATLSAAASVAMAAWQAGTSVRLVDSTGYDSGFSAQTGQLDKIMERLALAEPTSETDLARLATRIKSERHSCSMVLVSTNAASPAELQALVPASGRIRPITHILYRSRPAGDRSVTAVVTKAGPRASNVVAVELDPGTPLAEALAGMGRGAKAELAPQSGSSLS